MEYKGCFCWMCTNEKESLSHETENRQKVGKYRKIYNFAKVLKNKEEWPICIHILNSREFLIHVY